MQEKRLTLTSFYYFSRKMRLGDSWKRICIRQSRSYKFSQTESWMLLGIYSNVVKKICHVKSSFCIKLDYKILQWIYLKWELGPDALLDIGSFLFSIAFFYFYFLKYIPYRLNFCRYSLLPVIIFVTKTKFHHFQPTKFSPIRYFNIVTRYLYVNFVLIGKMIVTTVEFLSSCARFWMGIILLRFQPKFFFED